MDIDYYYEMSRWTHFACNSGVDLDCRLFLIIIYVIIVF